MCGNIFGGSPRTPDPPAPPAPTPPPIKQEAPPPTKSLEPATVEDESGVRSAAKKKLGKKKLQIPLTNLGASSGLGIPV